MLPPFVDAGWLRAHRDEVVLADCRWFLDGTDARREYLAGHLPGAVFVDLDTDLAAPPSPDAGRHPLPDPAAFTAVLRRLGISDGDRVVAYDQGSGAVAARLVWMLRVTGRDAAVLEGGTAAWEGPLEPGEVVREPTEDVQIRPWPADRVADADEVGRLAAGAGTVVDARAPERYRGEVEPVDPRPGHVPGAINVPYAGNVDDRGRLLPHDRLRERFPGADRREVAVYCGSGVTACHDVLALEAIGIAAKLFPGSWSAWSSDPERPAATGPEP